MEAGRIARERRTKENKENNTRQTEIKEQRKTLAGQTKNIVSVFWVKTSTAEGRRRFHKNTAYASLGCIGWCLGRDLRWPRPTLANSFSHFGHDLIWPRPTLATTYFGHDLLWPTAFPTLATTLLGHDLLWPRPTLATVSLTLATISFGHFRG